MIVSDFKHHKGLTIEGDISEVSAECTIIMGEIYKKNRETFNKEVAVGILTNMLIKAVDENNLKHRKAVWNTSKEEKLNYTE